MTSEAQAPAVESRPARGVVRVLIPVLLILAVLALMITVGLQRNRERIRAAEGGVDKGSQMVGAICDRAAQSLASLQNADGSWSGDMASTMRVLFNLKGTAYETDRLYETALGFVREQSGHLAPTVEVMSLGWFLLGADLVSPAELRFLLEDRATPEGLYRHAPESIEEDLLLLGVLPGLGMDASRLATALGDFLDRVGPVPPAWWLRSAYLASLVAESGSPEARTLRDRLVEGWRSADRVSGAAEVEPWEALDALSLAAYVKLRAEKCLSDADRCNSLNAPVRALLGGRADGLWTDAETTSVVLNALTTYRRVLEARIAGSAQR